ncbi:hypothetical protein CSUB01_12026 [Colletotrichum sublineola]|uniref:Uncharacterized protein n=1 Tax=Colletotrichum sublineola TaxID=1173701 RepID=A0A066XG46_COLSU|nr:hypothetical protein CSUB01_12026 [Colletotrichum sublineola]
MTRVVNNHGIVMGGGMYDVVPGFQDALNNHGIVMGGGMYDVVPGFQDARTSGAFTTTARDFETLIAEGVRHDIDVVERAAKSIKGTGDQ